jgi:hypothetical protein
VKLTTHLHLLPRLKNEWSYTSTPVFKEWCLVKHGDKFIWVVTPCSVVEGHQLPEVHATWRLGGSMDLWKLVSYQNTARRHDPEDLDLILFVFSLYGVVSVSHNDRNIQNWISWINEYGTCVLGIRLSRSFVKIWLQNAHSSAASALCCTAVGFLRRYRVWKLLSYSIYETLNMFPCIFMSVSFIRGCVTPLLHMLIRVAHPDVFLVSLFLSCHYHALSKPRCYEYPRFVTFSRPLHGKCPNFKGPLSHLI